jgi:hypothetical protein
MANHKRQLIHNITSANGLRVTITGAFIEIVRFIRWLSMGSLTVLVIGKMHVILEIIHFRNKDFLFCSQLKIRSVGRWSTKILGDQGIKKWWPVAEAEFGALFVNAKEGTVTRTSLSEMGHKQDDTELKTGNTT